MAIAMKRTPGIAAAAGSMSELARRLPAASPPAAPAAGQEPSPDPGVNECVSGVGVGVEMAFRAVTLAAEDDASLMARVQEGDRHAFGQLVGRYEGTVVNYLTRLTRDRSRAEELAQEAFLRLYQRAARYQERGQLLPYLLRIASNVLRP
jgi:hypothetical protein